MLNAVLLPQVQGVVGPVLHWACSRTHLAGTGRTIILTGGGAESELCEYGEMIRERSKDARSLFE